MDKQTSKVTGFLGSVRVWVLERFNDFRFRFGGVSLEVRCPCMRI